MQIISASKQQFILKNGLVFWDDSTFLTGDLWIQDGKIVGFFPQENTTGKEHIFAGYEIQENQALDSKNSQQMTEMKNSQIHGDQIPGRKDFPILDATGCLVIPGLIDTHFHGCNGYDFSDGTIAAIQGICEYELSQGITSVCPATMTLPENELLAICQTAAHYTHLTAENPVPRSDFIGFYMEGPFFSKEKAGAQRLDCLQNPNMDFFNRMMQSSEGLLKIWALAPELPGAAKLIQTICQSGNAVLKNPKIRSDWKPPVFSLGHTMSDGNAAALALESGARRLTHLYNAMENPMEIIDAALKYPKCYAELICDGIHNNKQRIQYAFDAFGEDHIILISDSMRATGLGDGRYTLGGQEVSVAGKTAVLANGKKAGSVSTLYDCLRCALTFGIPLKAALKACTCNPAKSLGLNHKIGSIRTGMQADLLIVDKELNIEKLMKTMF